MIQDQDIKADLSNTQLKDRTLYYDGDSVVSPDRIIELIDKGLNDLFVTEITDEITQFNRLSSKKILTKEEVRPLSFEWNIPEPYKSLDVVYYIANKAGSYQAEFLEKDRKIREARVRQELKLFKDLQLIPVLRAIIYVINTLHKNNIVWGVGRGSSVSSYVLYLIGVHDVDSVKYDLDITDFLRRPE